MTEIPDHLRKRAEEAREKAEKSAANMRAGGPYAMPTAPAMIETINAQVKPMEIALLVIEWAAKQLLLREGYTSSNAGAIGYVLTLAEHRIRSLDH
jgi:hypothetical protein